MRTWAGRVVAALALTIAVIAPSAAAAQEDHSHLTRASFRRNCLMCHGRAAPEGVSPEILAGLHPVPGLRPRDAMPNLTCWRRCTTCWPAEPAPAK
jgi:mono/diheme cytochrome c family protein